MDEETAPVEEAPEVTEADPQESPSAEPVESFTDINPTELPEEVTPEWLQERHKAMQADYTRKRQAEAEAAKTHQDDIAFLESLKSDPDTQRAVLEQLQELLAETEVEPQEQADPRDERIANLEQAETQRQSVGLATALKNHIDQLAADAKVELDESDFEEIFQAAAAGEQINGDNTAKAFQAFHDRRQALHTKWQESYLKSKEAPQQLPDGQSATQTYDFNDVEERNRRFAAMLEAK